MMVYYFQDCSVSGLCPHLMFQKQHNISQTRLSFWTLGSFSQTQLSTCLPIFWSEVRNRSSYWHIKFIYIHIYRVSQEEWTKLQESVPYVKLYRYNPKHLYPKLNGYGDNGQRSSKLWQLLLTYWLPNTYWNWQEYVVSVMLISVLNIKVTCEWPKTIKLNYKNTRTTVVFVLGFPSTLHRPHLIRYLVTNSPRSLHYDVS